MTEIGKQLKNVVDQESSRLLNMIFTRGHCHSLALAIMAIVGRGTVVVAGENGDFTHAAVLIDNRIIDIEGAHSVEEFEDCWGTTVAVTPKEFAERYEESFCVPFDIEMALPTAGEVLEKLEICDE